MLPTEPEIKYCYYLKFFKDEFTHYWNGWFFTKCCAFAVGYVVQVIGVTPDKVYIQLYEEDWDNPMDSDENKRNNKRWDFVKDIEANYSKPNVVYQINGESGKKREPLKF